MPAALSESVVCDSLLTPRGPWQRVDVLAVVDSTNAESLRDLLAWRLVAAGEQTAGRGRRSRSWSSPSGGSVSVSATVPLSPRPQEWGWLPLLTGLAMVAAVRAAGAAPPQLGLKWPNDVLAWDLGRADWAKVCGVLCEVGPGELAVAGAGVNVRVPAGDLPVPGATSLHRCGAPVSREAVIIGFGKALADLHRQWFEGGSGLVAVREAYRRECLTLGCQVRVDAPGGQVVVGQAVEVDEEGRIVVDTGAGTRSFSAGDVAHLRLAGPSPSRP